MEILFLTISLVCATGWLVYWVISLALLLFMVGKGCPEPTKSEMEECLKVVIRNLIKDLR